MTSSIKKAPLRGLFNGLINLTSVRYMLNNMQGFKMYALGSGRSHGAPSRIRTCDLRIRNPLLYPTELWARYPTPNIFENSAAI